MCKQRCVQFNSRTQANDTSCLMIIVIIISSIRRCQNTPNVWGTFKFYSTQMFEFSKNKKSAIQIVAQPTVREESFLLVSSNWLSVSIDFGKLSVFFNRFNSLILNETGQWKAFRSTVAVFYSMQLSVPFTTLPSIHFVINWAKIFLFGTRTLQTS